MAFFKNLLSFCKEYSISIYILDSSNFLLVRALTMVQVNSVIKFDRFTLRTRNSIQR